MRFVSTMALGLMLSIGGAAVVGVSPAIAAKKEKAPGQDFSNAFREVAANPQKSVQSKDFEAAKTHLTEIGRVSRRERVCMSVEISGGADVLKEEIYNSKKTKQNA